MITIQDVEHVAKLARLELTEEEKQKYTHQLGELLEYFEQLNEVDTTAVEPMSQAIPLVNVMREDIPHEPFDREKIIANAPLEENGYFRVPKILEE